jgi:hypothetical protein
MNVLVLSLALSLISVLLGVVVIKEPKLVGQARRVSIDD